MPVGRSPEPAQPSQQDTALHRHRPPRDEEQLGGASSSARSTAGDSTPRMKAAAHAGL
jgi:hypothetical protein